MKHSNLKEQICFHSNCVFSKRYLVHLFSEQLAYSSFRATEWESHHIKTHIKIYFSYIIKSMMEVTNVHYSTVSGTVRTLFTGCLVYQLVIQQYETPMECKPRICSCNTIRIFISTLNHKYTPPNAATIWSWNLQSREAHPDLPNETRTHIHWTAPLLVNMYRDPIQEKDKRFACYH